MSAEIAIRIGGTKADVDGFLRALRYRTEVEVLASAQSERPVALDQRFGQVELVNVLVSFSTSLAAGAAIEIIKLEFQRYRQGRPHMELDESPDSSSLPDAEEPHDPDQQSDGP
jgi:hypothetical protein